MATKVSLRRKAISQGRESLFLEFYPPIRSKSTMKLIYKEYLGIYIYQTPQNEIQKAYNQEMLLKAEGIRAIRVQSLINEDFGFLDKRKCKMIFSNTSAKRPDSKMANGGEPSNISSVS